MSGKQVKLFLIDGTPGGLTKAEITNWTGHVLAGPRSDLAQLLGREEARRTGVYLLLGEGDGIGEGRATSVRPTTSPPGCATTRRTRTSGTALSSSRARTPTSPRRMCATWRPRSSRSQRPPSGWR